MQIIELRDHRLSFNFSTDTGNYGIDLVVNDHKRLIGLVETVGLRVLRRTSDYVGMLQPYMQLPKHISFSRERNLDRAG